MKGEETKLVYEPQHMDMILEDLDAGKSLVLTDGDRRVVLERKKDTVQ